MNVVVGVLFAVLWSGVVFLLVRALLRRVFSGPQRDFVAAGFTIALLAGAVLPRTWIEFERAPLQESGTAAVAAPAAAPDVASTQTAAGPRDVSTACRAPYAKPPTTPFGQGSLDAVLSGSAPVLPAHPVSRRTELHFIGWTTVDAKTLSAAACLMVDGNPFPKAVSIYGGIRPDVGAAFANPAMTDSGYEIKLDPSDMPPNGTHVFAVVSLPSTGTPSLVYQPRSIEIRP